MDSTMVARVREGAHLRPLIVGCIVTIVAGAGLYGAAMGWWRSPRQAAFASVKLVLLFSGLFGLTTATNVVAAGLLRAKLSVAQVAVCTLVGLTVTTALLGAVAPVAMLWVQQVAPPTSGLTAATRTAHRLLAGHIVVFAVAGTLGVLRVYRLVCALIADPRVARRVLWAWLAVEGLVGAELSWVGRPFLGKPALPVTFLRSDAFDSSFFEELGTMTHAAAGPIGPWVASLLALVAGIAVAVRLAGGATATFRIDAHGLVVQHIGSATTVRMPWTSIRAVRLEGTTVTVGCEDADALHVDNITLPCMDADVARMTYERIERARHPVHGPFRANTDSGDADAIRE